jgi:hypothetical protein
VSSIGTAGGRRSMDSCITRDRDRAVAMLVELCGAFPGAVDGANVEKFFWAWAGRVALGPRPLVASDARPDAIAAIDSVFEAAVARLAHSDRNIAAASTLAIAACRGHAAAAQHAIAMTPPRHPELACCLRLASGVLARDTGVASELARWPDEPGQPAYYADIVRRGLVGDATARELEVAQYYERWSAKLPWVSGDAFATTMRALIRARTDAERDAAALALVEEDHADRAIVLVFEPGALPSSLTAAQRRVLATPMDHRRHASQIAILCDAYGIPRTDGERAKLAS